MVPLPLLKYLYAVKRGVSLELRGINPMPIASSDKDSARAE
jgi:hypothetical protein